MTESGSGSEMTIEKLAKRVDDQARFTRSVNIICTLANLAVVIVILIEMFSHLPEVIILQYMGNLQKIVQEWKVCEQSMNAKGQIKAEGTQAGTTK